MGDAVPPRRPLGTPQTTQHPFCPPPALDRTLAGVQTDLTRRADLSASVQHWIKRVKQPTENNRENCGGYAKHDLLLSHSLAPSPSEGSHPQPVPRSPRLATVPRQ